jgi:hypothetical protein
VGSALLIFCEVGKSKKILMVNLRMQALCENMSKTEVEDGGLLGSGTNAAVSFARGLKRR